VIFEDEELTYRELNARANQLAHHLRGLGVRPEVLVGICVERSVEMVVGLLGKPRSVNPPERERRCVAFLTFLATRVSRTW
jgi:non-ribosomal peptide synthetase component F